MDLFDIEKLNTYKNSGKSFCDMARRIRINPLIADYYEHLGCDYEDVLVTRGLNTTDFYSKCHRRAERILECGRRLTTTQWKESKVHHVTSVQLCADKFCGNCQKQFANRREHRYTPLLQVLGQKYDMYHIALTVPNCTGFFLPETVGNILKAFGKMMKFFLCRKKIRGLPFEGLGCRGAIRSLEITMNESMSTYHPHLHCIFVFRKGVDLDKPKVFTNSFSYSRGRKVQQFSAFEVLVQKLWRLCYDGDKVTKAAIESLQEGYSCIVNYADGNFHQIFKYAVAGLLADKKKAMRKDGNVQRGLSYTEFKDLYFALENRRALQGYGCFYGLKLDEAELNADDTADEEVKSIIRALNGVEEGNFTTEKLRDVIENIVVKKHVYFSDKDIKSNLDSLSGDDT